MHFRILQCILLILPTLIGVAIVTNASPALCDISCCKFYPDCDKAKRVICKCPNDIIRFGDGDMPRTVRKITIDNTKELIIEPNASKNLPSLAIFELKNIGKLKVHKKGMELSTKSKLLLFSIHNTNDVQVNSNAFAGNWPITATIRMYNISRLILEPNALNYQAANRGLKVSLTQVKYCRMGASNASISFLTMDDITMMVTCNGGIMGGNPLHTESNKVTMYQGTTADCEHAPRTPYSMATIEESASSSSDLQLVKKITPTASSGGARFLCLGKLNLLIMYAFVAMLVYKVCI